MRLVSGSNSIKLDHVLNSLDQSIDRNEMEFEFHDQMLTLDEKEHFIMTLIEKEGTNGKNVRLKIVCPLKILRKKTHNLKRPNCPGDSVLDIPVQIGAGLIAGFAAWGVDNETFYFVHTDDVKTHRPSSAR